MKRTTLIVFILALIGGLPLTLMNNTAIAYDLDNEFIKGAFPEKIIIRTFSIPLDEKEVLVIYPKVMEPDVKELRSKLARKCGCEIPFQMADDIVESDLRGKHFIIIGNIINNRWALELYKRRYAFADAYFPGKGGVVIHPVTSIWDPERFVLVIGVSDDEGTKSGFETFIELLDKGAGEIGALHHLETSLEFPTIPESIASILDRVRKNINTSRGPYGLIPNWGLCYYLTGNTKWAEHFRDGMALLYERAEKTGKWFPEPWTNVYFLLWKMMLVWDLLDEDPFFSLEDHKMIEEVLWGYFTFCRGSSLPLLEKEWCLPDEIRQNHATFMALSLFYAHRFYTEKYNMQGLEDVAEKFTRCFEGQAQSFRPNDDAGGYLNYAPIHTLNYLMAIGDDSFMTSGRLAQAADLAVAVIDNRQDKVSFGDVGSYRHHVKGGSYGLENKFLGMAAWYYRDGEYQWLYNWRSSDSVFSIESLYNGDYVTGIQTEKPDRFLGVCPVMLDDGAIRWCSRRSGKNSFIPVNNEQYLDKMSFRAGFSPEEEYLLLDGTSTFAHGHHDGNTVTRLTWKDRVWLFDLDYIKSTPKYHNGVVITRNGIQEEPPPLTLFEYAADFKKFGITKTTSGDFNGAEWERHIIWKKGRYFLFIDRIIAQQNGKYRLECRWRTRGETTLAGNTMTVKQGDKTFSILSADDASRKIESEPDGLLSNWYYPYGDGALSISRARKDLILAPNDEWIFTALMYADDEPVNKQREVYKFDDGTYIINDGNNRELAGLDASLLEHEGVYTDCSLFTVDSHVLMLINASYVKFGDVAFETLTPVHVAINFTESSGALLIPVGNKAKVSVRNIIIEGKGSGGKKNDYSVTLNPGTYAFTFKGDVWNTEIPLDKFFASAHKVYPNIPEIPQDFGLEVLKKFSLHDKITAFCKDEKALVCGNAIGKIVRFEQDKQKELCTIPPSHRILSLHAADIDSDSTPEIFVGDDNQTFYCFDASGQLKWKYLLTRYYGSNANATDITTGEILPGRGKTIFAATNGWKLYAFEPDGTVKWESFIYYHPLTKVKMLNSGDETLLAVGTVYHTPLNVVDAGDGKVRWFTWEQAGDEFLSATQYCGIHLADMIFMDADLDGSQDIVFGTKYNRIYALDSTDGATKWETNVGDEVTVLKEMSDPMTGGNRIIAGTAAGDLMILDRSGAKLNMISLRSEISDIEIIPYPEQKRNDIAVSTCDGRVIICDNNLLMRASISLGNEPLMGLSAGEKTVTAQLFYAVSAEGVNLIKYSPSFLRKSRHY